MITANIDGGLDHVELYVSDLERSRSFWGWLLAELGWVPFQEWASGFSYIRGSTYIVFVQVEPQHAYPSYHRRHVGLNHLALRTRNPLHLDALTTQLRDREITLLCGDRPIPPVGRLCVFFEDPDRIKVELVADTPERPSP
jgi:catechol 2,3-dioxygenase-like lactoylglutathione lyase family enzyme